MARQLEPVRISFQPFLLVPRNLSFFMGDSPYPAIDLEGKQRLIAFVVAFVVVAVLIIAVGVNGMGDDFALQQSGKTTQATVIRRSADKDANYYLTYQFDVGATNNPYAKRQLVQKETYDAHPVNSEIDIVYLPNNPDISHVVESGGSGSGYVFFLIFAVGWLILPTIIAIALIRPIVQDRLLARNGRIIEGKLIRCDGYKRSRRENYDWLVTAEYGFTSPSGAEITGKQSAVRNDLRSHPAPEVGLPVAVLYLDDQHHRML